MTASTADCYGILGLTSDATLAAIKKAYRKLARQHHPEISPVIFIIASGTTGRDAR